MNADKSSEWSKKVTDVCAEMHKAIVKLAGERSWCETREAWIARAARKADIPYRAAKALFYREVSDPKSSIVERVRHAVAMTNKCLEDNTGVDYKKLKIRIEELQRQLNEITQNSAR